MYENLATKYRPKTLADLMGQEAVKTTLTNAVKLNRVGHSYVFYGPRGCGKTTVARILAKTLNCHNPGPDGSPCGKCSSCTEIAESKSLDVIEIDAASNTAVDNVRSVIVDQVNFAPSRDKYKIYILDEVHMLSKGSFNALLKTLEEPPSHVVFIMATTEQEKVPPTILSRSQCFRFKFIPENEIAERLKFVCAQEKLSIDSGSLRLITKACGGAMRDALTLLDRAASFCGNDITVSVLNDLLGRPNDELLQVLALSLINRDPEALHSSFSRIAAEGYDVMAAMRELRNLISEAFFAKAGLSDAASPIKGLPESVSAGLLARLSRKLTVLIKEVQYSDVMDVAAEVGLYTLIETPQDISSLVRRLEELESRLSAAGGADSGGLVRYGTAAPSKKKDDLNAGSQYRGESVPVPSAGSLSAASNAARTINSAEFAEAWRKTLARISSSRPLIYNELVECKISNDGSGSAVLVAKNPFYANRVSFALEEIGEIMSSLLGRKIDFAVTSGAAAMKEAVSVPVPKDIPAPVPETKQSVPVPKNGTSAADYAPDGDFPMPDGGEEAEITEFEENPPKEAVSAPRAEKKEMPAPRRAAPSSEKTAKNEPKVRIQPGLNVSRANAPAQGKEARHAAARLEFVPPEEIPADFAVLSEVFGQSITRVNKVL